MSQTYRTAGAHRRLSATEAAIGDRLPYARHLDEATVQTRDGLLIQVLRLEGFPFETVDNEELDALRYALDQLRPRDRALLALVQEGRSHAEIAETLDTSVAAVKARLHRAREQLRLYYISHED